MKKLLPLFAAMVLVFSGCGVKLVEEVGPEGVVEVAAEDIDLAVDIGILEVGSGSVVEEVIISGSGDVDSIYEEHEEIEYVEGEIRQYCDEEEKAADWCNDGFIKYKRSVEGCFESYCKAKPKAVSFGTGAVVGEISGGIRLEQPKVRLELTFDDLEDVDLEVLTIDQIEEFGRVKIRTNMGDMLVKLHPTKVPASVRSFVNLADGAYLRDLPIYRVIEDFVFQFGESEDVKRNDSVDFSFGDDLSGSVTNKRASIAFAGLDLTTFFINVGDNSVDLDGDFSPFGEVVAGLEVMEDIASVRTDINDAPVNQLIVSDIELDDVYEEYITRKID